LASAATGSGPGRWRSRPARRRPDAAKTFIDWATNKDYLALVASKEGWANVPPGTRTSLYDNPEYQKVPFAKMTLDSINSADPTAPDRQAGAVCRRPVRRHPGVPGLGTAVGEIFSAALAGQKTADDALARSAGRRHRRDEGRGLHQVTPGLPFVKGRYPKPSRPRLSPILPHHSQGPPNMATAPCHSSSRFAARLMVAPSVILLLLWMIVPLAMTLYYSFRSSLQSPRREPDGLGRASPTTCGIS
jgi:hypothetical protein